MKFVNLCLFVPFVIAEQCSDILTTDPFPYSCDDISASFSLEECFEIEDLTGHDCYDCCVEFNSHETLSSTSTSTSTPCSTLTPSLFSFQTGSCDESNYCTLLTKNYCQNAALSLGHWDTTANVLDRTDVVSGCSTNNRGGLRFNEVMENGVEHSSSNGKKVLCMLCNIDFDNYSYVDGQCDGEYYCSIDNIEECQDVALELGHDDTTANLIDKSNAVYGCSINNRGGLRFNQNVNSTHVHATGGSYVLCKRCQD